MKLDERKHEKGYFPVDFDYFSQLCNPQSNSGPDRGGSIGFIHTSCPSLEQPAKENV